MKRSLAFALSTFVGLILISSAALADRVPDWVNGPSSEYESEQYLTGVGIADDRVTAEQRARSNLASIFSTHIDSTTVIAASATTGAGGPTKSQSVSEKIKATTAKVLEGVEIVEHWQNPTTKQHCALAVLEKGKAIKALLGKIGEIEAEAKQVLAKLGTTEDRFARAGLAIKLLATGTRRDAAVTDVRVLNPGSVPKAAIDWAAARATANQTLGSLVVSVTGPTKGPALTLVTNTIKALNELGIKAWPALLLLDSDGKVVITSPELRSISVETLPDGTDRQIDGLEWALRELLDKKEP